MAATDARASVPNQLSLVVRAGTVQALASEGARGESAARCTNCQVGTQSSGRSISVRVGMWQATTGSRSARH